MLTIRAAQNPAYYERREFAREEYYTERGVAPGEWIGRGSQTLGLVGSPEVGDLEQLLRGESPASGDRLAGLREGRRNAGFDLTWTAPKSVSILHAIGDERLQSIVLAAQESGVRAGLDYLERYECQARRGAGGARTVEAGGFAGAIYSHEMSRTGDPHLHSHLVIANAVQGPDGRWSAQDMRPVYAAAKTAGTIAEAVLRAELTDRLGVRWGPVVNGTAELANMPSEVLREFSRRHVEIAELALARGASTIQAVGAVQRETRDRKPTLEYDVAVDQWRARAAEHGLGRKETAELLWQEHRNAIPPAVIEAIGERLAGPEGLTRQASTFDRRAVIRAFAEYHRQGIHPTQLETLADRWIESRAIQVEHELPEVGRRASWTTPELLATEARMIALAHAKAAGPRVPAEVVERVLARHPEAGLDQALAVRHLAAGDGPVRVMVAPAGTGKTYTLGLTRDAFDHAGIPMVGCAWQGQAAQVLETDAGIRSRTIASLLADASRHPVHALPRGGVLVVDEAGTVPTRPLAELLRHAAEREMAVLLVGDHRQLPSIDAGGGLHGIATRIGAVELTENRRQTSQLQQDIAEALANGRARQALDLLVDNQRIQTHPTTEAARQVLIADWREHGLHNPSRTLILAHDREDVRALNRLARYEMDSAGLLGPERLVADGREWAVGDRLVCRKNDYRPGLDIRNGTRATVTELNPDAGGLAIRTDDGRNVRLPADYLEHAHHAYAITGHISQGVTVDRTYLLASPERGGREWGYVAASRHRIDLRVHTIGESPDQAIDALTRGWERTQAKTLAIDLIERTAQPEIEFTIGGPLPGPRLSPREISPEISEFRVGDPRRGIEPETHDLDHRSRRPGLDLKRLDRIEQPGPDLDPHTERLRPRIEHPGPEIDFGP